MLAFLCYDRASIHDRLFCLFEHDISNTYSGHCIYSIIKRNIDYVYHEPGSVLKSTQCLQSTSYCIFLFTYIMPFKSPNNPGDNFYYLHFIDQKTDVKRVINSPMVTSYQMAQLSLLDSTLHTTLFCLLQMSDLTADGLGQRQMSKKCIGMAMEMQRWKEHQESGEGVEKVSERRWGLS